MANDSMMNNHIGSFDHVNLRFNDLVLHTFYYAHEGKRIYQLHHGVQLNYISRTCYIINIFMFYGKNAGNSFNNIHIIMLIDKIC